MLTKVLDTVWTHKGYTGSCYVENVEMIFKVTGTMIPGPTIEGYKQAWVSVSNTMILMNSVMQLCNEIIVAKNNGGASNQQMGDCQLLMRTYLDCLKKSGGYVASVMRNSFVMQGYLARYDSALNNCASHSRYFPMMRVRRAILFQSIAILANNASKTVQKSAKDKEDCESDCTGIKASA